MLKVVHGTSTKLTTLPSNASIPLLIPTSSRAIFIGSSAVVNLARPTILTNIATQPVAQFRYRLTSPTIGCLSEPIQRSDTRETRLTFHFDRLYWINNPGDPATTFTAIPSFNRFYYFLEQDVSLVFTSANDLR